MGRALVDLLRPRPGVLKLDRAAHLCASPLRILNAARLHCTARWFGASRRSDAPDSIVCDRCASILPRARSGPGILGRDVLCACGAGAGLHVRRRRWPLPVSTESNRLA
eukprot:4286472-Prymnesium_polylepis.1